MPKEKVGDLLKKIPRKSIKVKKRKTFKVRDWSGKDSMFNPRRFQLWLRTNLDISKGRARRVVYELQREFRNSRIVESKDLILKASRLALQLPYSRKDLLNLPVFGESVMPQVGVGDAIGVAGGLAEEGIDLLSDYYGGQWQQEDGGTKETKETGGGLFFGDDGTAPHLDFGWAKPLGCCEYRGVPAINVPIKISVTDDSDNLGNDSGVDTVEISAYDPMPNGKASRTTLGKWDFDYWEDSNDEDEETPAEVTEDEKVEWEDEICIPCNYIERGRARLKILVKDKDDNKQIEYKTIVFNPNTVDKCCP